MVSIVREKKKYTYEDYLKTPLKGLMIILQEIF